MGDTPTSPGQGLRPCNPLLALADERSSPVVDAHWWDITPIRRRVPPNLNTDPTLVVMPGSRCFKNRQVIVFLILESVHPQSIQSGVPLKLAPLGKEVRHYVRLADV